MVKKTVQRKDFTQVAFSVFQKAIDGGKRDEVDQKKNAVRTAKRRGGIAGGNARATALSKQQRSDIARLAAMARWKKSG